MIDANEPLSDTIKDETTTEQAQTQSESQQNEPAEQNAETEIDELSVLKNEITDQKDKFMRLLAEFDNFKKRSAKERIELYKTAGQEIIKELLPVLDDFQRADKAYAADSNAENYANGVKLIQEKLQKTLQNKGLKIIESIGQDFNIEQHEAIAEVPAPNEEQKGKVLDEVESGYTLNDTIIRYAKVVVGK
ncbi:MAG: nucleotide exchange factor GrpE [Chitinophagales bacterium]